MSAADPASPLTQVLPGMASAWLHDTAASRALESAALQRHPPHELMRRAGWAAARWVRALAPHAQRIWVAAGPGNNGGDGLVLAKHLHAHGQQVHVTLLADPQRLPADAAWAYAQARDAGVAISDQLADIPAGPPDVAVDALLGLGQRRSPQGQLAAAVQQLRSLSGQSKVLALDLPTGLCADTGQALGNHWVQADATLALLTLKPGLFTGVGRDAAGAVWWAGLEQQTTPPALASAQLIGAELLSHSLPARRHAQHKGSFGDVWVIGGAPGMAGAAHLAAQASLLAGAGRVYLSLLDGQRTRWSDSRPELMQREVADWRHPGVLENATVVCGCGGGQAVAAVLPEVLARSGRLVLDADAINLLAQWPGLKTAMRARSQAGQPSILTPHPLEAARLLGVDTAIVQARRLWAAQQLAQTWGCVLVLKGSGTVVAAPEQLPLINPTGNARLATPGSGDVLAGWLGGLWSAQNTQATSALTLARQCAGAAVWLHGQAVSTDAAGLLRLPVPAKELAQAMAQAAQR